MLKKVFAVMAMMFVVSAAFAEIKPYAALRAGISYLHTQADISKVTTSNNTFLHDSNGVFLGAAAIGAKYNFLRAELEYSYRGTATQKYHVATVKSDFQSYMFNLYYDFDTETKVSPFVMAGAGLSTVYIDDTATAVEYRDELFTYNVGLGLTYALNEKINLDLGYKFVRTNDASVSNGSVDVATFSNDLYFGARYTF